MSTLKSLPGNAKIALSGIFIFSLAVAFLQLYRVEVENYERWKGGGMGMFSDVFLRRVIILDKDMVEDGQGTLVSGPSLRKDIRNVLIQPTEPMIDKLCRKLKMGRYISDYVWVDGKNQTTLRYVEASGSDQFEVARYADRERISIDQLMITVAKYEFDPQSKRISPVVLRETTCPLVATQ